MATADRRERPTPNETHYPQDDLAQYLRQHRDGCPSELARELLRYDRPPESQLVGISGGGLTAYIYYGLDNDGEGYIVDVPIDETGLESEEGPIVHGHGQAVETFVRRLEWPADAWLHPRYR